MLGLSTILPELEYDSRETLALEAIKASAISVANSKPSGRSVHCSANLSKKSLEYFLVITPLPSSPLSLTCFLISEVSNFGVDMSAASSQSSGSTLLWPEFSLDTSF
ncbi:unnamed protein product [Coffea canephora]|uniref:Uncharacterized protein n=1 Tax=Coffea canephora TaxID=49390 RepID=A0A068UMC2_COFCA|nr:unnamed protein product [Coffea canephora]